MSMIIIRLVLCWMIGFFFKSIDRLFRWNRKRPFTFRHFWQLIFQFSETSIEQNSNKFRKAKDKWDGRLTVRDPTVFASLALSQLQFARQKTFTRTGRHCAADRLIFPNTKKEKAKKKKKTNIISGRTTRYRCQRKWKICSSRRVLWNYWKTKKKIKSSMPV